MPALNSLHLVFVSFLVGHSLYWASVAPFSLQDATVERAFLASEVEQRILAPRMTLPTTSTARLRTTTAGGIRSLYHADMESGATATSARPAVPPGCSPFCPWMGRCTAQWIATEWSPWWGVRQPSRLLWDSSCQRWGQWKPQLLGWELRRDGTGQKVFLSTSKNFAGSIVQRPGLVQSSYKICQILQFRLFYKLFQNIGWVWNIPSSLLLQYAELLLSLHRPECYRIFSAHSDDLNYCTVVCKEVTQSTW